MAIATGPKMHYLRDDEVHDKWDVDNAPTLEIEPRDTVIVWTRAVSDNQITPGADISALASFDWERAYPLTGPIAVAGAMPGDTLSIEVLDINTQGWGWTGVIPDASSI